MHNTMLQVLAAIHWADQVCTWGQHPRKFIRCKAMVRFNRETYSYSVDARDRLCEVNEAWLAFAAENNARGLNREAVLGHPLWDFVSGNETIQLYQNLLARVRKTQNPVVLPFRCDSPTLERHMRMNILPEPSAGIRFDCVIEKVRQIPELQVLNPDHPNLQLSLDMCSFCKRIEVSPLGWLEVAEAVGRLNLFDVQRVPELLQMVCPDCRKRAEEIASVGHIAPE